MLCLKRAIQLPGDIVEEMSILRSLENKISWRKIPEGISMKSNCQSSKRRDTKIASRICWAWWKYGKGSWEGHSRRKDYLRASTKAKFSKKRGIPLIWESSNNQTRTSIETWRSCFLRRPTKSKCKWPDPSTTIMKRGWRASRVSWIKCQTSEKLSLR